MIHCLIPTRGRPEKLIELLKSLHATVNDKTAFKVMLRIDRDDLATINALFEIQEFKNVSWIIGDEPMNGGHDVHKLYQELSDAVPEGDFVWFLNDDCVVEGKYWDADIMAHLPFEGYMAHPEVVASDVTSYSHIADGPFPIVPNKCWEKFGHNGLGNNPDVWLHLLLCIENGWLVHFLKGITVNHCGKVARA